VGFPDRPAAVRADWERRIGRRGVPGRDGQVSAPGSLPPPSGLRASPGRGHVMLDWDAVPGAAGYLVYQAGAAGGRYKPLDHGGGDVLAVPAAPYADTSGEPGRVRHYAVAAVADGESAGPLSDPVAAAPGTAPAAALSIDVTGAAAGELARPWEPMIGSEHLSYLLRRDLTGAGSSAPSSARRSGSPTTSSACARSARTASCATTSGCTANRAAVPGTTSAASTGCTTS
jgi:xylan 1,4-beta-xylosidase